MQETIIEKGNKYTMNTYTRFPVVFERGQGVYLYDKEGNKYLDFVAGIAVNCLGYGNKDFIGAIHEQLNKLNHVSNLYWTEPAVIVAEMLVKYSKLDQVFFCNSGAESVESALKLSRIYSEKKKGQGCYEIVAMNHSFHGRTTGALSVTGQEKYHKYFKPLLPGVKFADFNEINDLKLKINEKTAGVIVEPIQGEGGINPAQKDYLQQVRRLCDENDIPLIFDEVQTGIGRTGELFAYQHYGVSPDIVACAKGLGNGIPIGAIIAKDEIAKQFTPGTHASTFGGNAISTTAARVVLSELMEKGIIDAVKENGEYLNLKLKELQSKYSVVEDVRGIGLMQGIQLKVKVSEIVNEALKRGLLLVSSGNNVIRFVPPLIITRGEIDEGINILDKIIDEIV